MKDNQKYIIVPMAGNGLWGPVWGFVALEDDYETIHGAAFDHKAETLVSVLKSILIFLKFHLKVKKFVIKMENLSLLKLKKVVLKRGTCHK